MQKSVVVPLHHHILAMHEIIQSHIRKCTSNGQKYKCIAFFTTARIAGFMSELFLARWPEHYSPKNLWEIHSRKSQSHRINVAKQFTAGDNCILFSSDVSARGVDYPNVSFVLQVGAPSEKAQYIHRLGRTARAGQAGEGVLMLCDFERVFMKEVEDLEISPLTTPAILQEQVQQEQQCLRQLLESNERLKASGASAYQAFLGYYNSNMRRLKLQSKQELVLIANEYATMIGFPEGQPPALLAKTVGKMQLKDVAGIRIDRGGSAERGGRGRNSNRGRGGRGVKTLR
jgi:ATP-dependent RNA helicase MSS116